MIVETHQLDGNQLVQETMPNLLDNIDPISEGNPNATGKMLSYRDKVIGVLLEEEAIKVNASNKGGSRFLALEDLNDELREDTRVLEAASKRMEVDQVGSVEVSGEDKERRDIGFTFTLSTKLDLKVETRPSVRSNEAHHNISTFISFPFSSFNCRPPPLLFSLSQLLESAGETVSHFFAYLFPAGGYMLHIATTQVAFGMRP
ncbi:unnamed protein product [Linum tenue]|uniref:Uncharacterized protein n=1 Tax=Linum tenue TaxID=586396 RepID=A0AAV0GVC3_9ROSI|nr:unnamed protein product [Linum tenue]